MVWYKVMESTRYAKYTGCLESNTNASKIAMREMAVRSSKMASGCVIITLTLASGLGLLGLVSLMDAYNS